MLLGERLRISEVNFISSFLWDYENNVYEQ